MRDRCWLLPVINTVINVPLRGKRLSRLLDPGITVDQLCQGIWSGSREQGMHAALSLPSASSQDGWSEPFQWAGLPTSVNSSARHFTVQRKTFSLLFGSHHYCGWHCHLHRPSLWFTHYFIFRLPEGFTGKEREASG